MMHFSDDSGRRVQATLTMDGESVTQLDGSDVQLAASLQWSGPGVTSSDEIDLDSAEKSGLDGTETASSAGQQLRLEPVDVVAPSQNGPDHVISASDLPTTKR
jgi:hypothetical protein